MKKITFLLPFALLFFGSSALAQVKFKLEFDHDTEKYTVSVVPMQTYASPQNITGTGQVTIKVPTNEFEVVNIENLLQGMPWEANSRNNTPAESPDYDYISFALVIQGTAYPDYQEGVDLPLFSFQNAYDCVGPVYLVDNEHDPFMPPNSQSANIGNSITILGAGGDAYGGLIEGGMCDCSASPTSTTEEIGLSSTRVFPNPASNVTNLEINWEGETADAYLKIVDATGKTAKVEKIELVYGKISNEIMVRDLAAGSYFLYLFSEDWEVALDKLNVVK